MTPEERLPGLSNRELLEELALAELPEELWIEVGLRLGVDHGASHTTEAPEARGARWRRFAALWTGQPEAAGSETRN